jgi:hypothetical protein
MRHVALRSLLCSGLLLLVSALASPAAHAGDDSPPERDRRETLEIIRGLKSGIESLRALGGQERVIGHLEELVAQLKRSQGQRRRMGEAKQARGEAERLGRMAEIMTMAQNVLREAGHEEAARVLHRGVLGLRALWSGSDSDEVQALLADAPSSAEQARALLAAARLLGEQDHLRRARLCSELAAELGGPDRPGRKAKKREREEAAARRADDPEHPALGELSARLRVLRMAMPALREGEQREAAALLARAIRSAELLLAERTDEEAQALLRETPPLGELAEVLDLAAGLWKRFRHAEEAHAVASLSRYYRRRLELDPEQRARADEEEREEAEDEARRARARGWSARQEQEVQARRERARAAEMEADRRREHEQRMREQREPGHGDRESREERRPGESTGESTDARINELRAELSEVQRALHQLMQELRELAARRK